MKTKKLVVLLLLFGSFAVACGRENKNNTTATSKTSALGNAPATSNVPTPVATSTSIGSCLYSPTGGTYPGLCEYYFILSTIHHMDEARTHMEFRCVDYSGGIFIPGAECSRSAAVGYCRHERRFDHSANRSTLTQILSVYSAPYDQDTAREHCIDDAYGSFSTTAP